ASPPELTIAWRPANGAATSSSTAAATLHFDLGVGAGAALGWFRLLLGPLAVSISVAVSVAIAGVAFVELGDQRASHPGSARLEPLDRARDHAQAAGVGFHHH